MLDILGFRQMVKTRRLSSLVDQLNLLFAAAEPKEASCGLRLTDGRVRKRNLTLGHLYFSDTIMLWTPPMDARDGDFNALAFSHICNTVGNLIALALINSLPLRGGLAFGECYIDPAKQLAVGQPIVDAYLLEQNQEWLGAAISSEQLCEPSTYEHLDEWCGLVRYDVPTKITPSHELFAVDWTRIARMPRIVTQSLWKINAQSAVERALSEGLAAATQESVYRKWQNAAEFFRSQAQRQPLAFVRYRGPDKGWETVADEPPSARLTQRSTRTRRKRRAV